MLYGYLTVLSWQTLYESSSISWVTASRFEFLPCKPLANFKKVIVLPNGQSNAIWRDSTALHKFSPRNSSGRLQNKVAGGPQACWGQPEGWHVYWWMLPPLSNISYCILEWATGTSHKQQGILITSLVEWTMGLILVKLTRLNRYGSEFVDGIADGLRSFRRLVFWTPNSNRCSHWLSISLQPCMWLLQSQSRKT